MYSKIFAVTALSLAMATVAMAQIAPTGGSAGGINADTRSKRLPSTARAPGLWVLLVLPATGLVGPTAIVRCSANKACEPRVFHRVLPNGADSDDV